MKTTLELPDELMRAVKIKAVNEGRRIKDVVADLISRGLSQPAGQESGIPVTVQLPLIHGAHPARPEDEATPERVAALLDQADAEAARDPR